MFLVELDVCSDLHSLEVKVPALISERRVRSSNRRYADAMQSLILPALLRKSQETSPG